MGTMGGPWADHWTMGDLIARRAEFSSRDSENDFAKIKMSVLSMPPVKLAKDNSVDMVLTFRNLHNWLKSGYLENVFQVSFKDLLQILGDPTRSLIF